MAPEAAILTVAGPSIGLGHLRRCLTLAEAMKKLMAVRFVIGEGAEIARHAGFSVDDTPRSSDILIADDYSLTADDLKGLAARTRRLAIIDDLADRSLEAADLVLNTSPAAEKLQYRTRPECVKLLGPRYALLHPAFRGQPQRTLPSRLQRILVTLGGADPHQDTPAVVETIMATLPGVEIDVVIGPLFAEESRVAAVPGVRVHPPQPNLATLMRECDLAVSAGGQTTHELAASGLPAIALEIADNQRDNLRALAAVPTLLALPRGDRPALEAALQQLAGDRALRQVMSDHGRLLFDGCGADRAAAAISAL